MKGKIEIKGVKVMACHGVFDFERESEHPFVADATLYADLGADDKLEKTCDYGEAAKLLTEVLSAPAVALIETLAVRAARAGGRSPVGALEGQRVCSSASRGVLPLHVRET